jgi:hypothetical protein
VHLAHTIQTAPSLDVLLTTVCGHHMQAFKTMAVCVLCSVHVHWTGRKLNNEDGVMMPDNRTTFFLCVLTYTYPCVGWDVWDHSERLLQSHWRKTFITVFLPHVLRSDNNGGSLHEDLNVILFSVQKWLIWEPPAGEFPYSTHNVLRESLNLCRIFLWQRLRSIFHKLCRKTKPHF